MIIFLEYRVFPDSTVRSSRGPSFFFPSWGGTVLGNDGYTFMRWITRRPVAVAVAVFLLAGQLPPLSHFFLTLSLSICGVLVLHEYLPRGEVKFRRARSNF